MGMLYSLIDAGDEIHAAVSNYSSVSYANRIMWF